MMGIGDGGNLRDTDNTINHISGGGHGVGPQEIPPNSPYQITTIIYTPENKNGPRGRQRDRLQAEPPPPHGDRRNQTPMELGIWDDMKGGRRMEPTANVQT